MPRIPGLRRVFRLADAAVRADPLTIDDELRFHVESRVEELMTGGASERDARAAAHGEFGDWNRYRRACLTIDSHFARETRMRDFVNSMWSDLRHAARGLRAQPGFAAVAILTLALGIGATTSVFSAVSGVLLRPLPYAHADRIMHVGERDVAKPGGGGTTSYENYDDWRRRATSFASMGIVSNWSPTLTGHGDAERLRVALVSSSMFEVFGVRPYLGRAIVAADNDQGAAPVAVMSYDYWRTRFGADPSVVGRSLVLNGLSVLIVGVLAPGFVGPSRLDCPMWGNFVASSSDGRGGRSKEGYALLRPGVTAGQAQAEMSRISSDLAVAYPKDNAGRTVVVDPLATLVVGDVRRPLYLLLGASFVVLLIACANLSNLLLARGTTRTRELAMRAALGAGRRRIARQLLTESLLLSVIGTIGGIAIAAAAIKLLIALGPVVFRSRPPSLSIAVLLVSIGLSCLSALLFGLVPALRMSPADPQTALREASSRVAGGRGSALRNALAVAQLALAVVLLSASTLVVKSFARVLQVDPGIHVDHVLTASVFLPPTYDSTKSTLFYRQLAARLESTPGVAAVAFTGQVPFSGNFDRVNITKIAGEADRAGSGAATGDRYVVSPSYFATMGVRLVRGRLPDASDRFDAPTVSVVDEVFAQHTFGGREAIGRQFEIPGRARPDYATIVGVVTHVKTYGLDAESPGQIYLSNEQFPWRFSSIAMRTRGEPESMIPALTRAVHELDANQPVSNVVSMDSLMADLLRARRFTLMLLSAFAAVAMALAAIGLYGVIAYGVTQRRRELGVRIALGARRGQIARMIVLEGGRIAVVGAVLGAAGALASGRLIASMLFEVSARDVGAFAAVSGSLVCIALLACAIPAHRATRVDAAEVLRGD